MKKAQNKAKSACTYHPPCCFHVEMRWHTRQTSTNSNNSNSNSNDSNNNNNNKANNNKANN
jgi:hypothetical protein